MSIDAVSPIIHDPIVRDIVINLASGLVLPFMEYVRRRVSGDPQQRALQQTIQRGFETMLFAAGDGLSEAELNQVSKSFQLFLAQPGVADAFLDMAFTFQEPDLDQLVRTFYEANQRDSLVHIKFDLRNGILIFVEGFRSALMKEAKRNDSPLANQVSITLLDTLSRQTRYFREYLQTDMARTPTFVASRLANIDLRRRVTSLAICRSSPNVVYGLFDGTLFVSQDRARTWNATSGGTGIIAADPVRPNVIYNIRTTGVHVSEDFGESWIRRSAAVSRKPISGGDFMIHPEDPNRLLYADNRGIFVSSNQGLTWRNCFPQWIARESVPWFYAIDKERVDLIVAVYYDELILITDDFGRTWSEIAAPPTGGKPHPGILQPLTIDSDTSSIWYADLGAWRTPEREKLPKGVFVTHDRGANWDFVTPNEARTKWIIDYIEIVRETDVRVVYAATPSLLFCSRDEGASWVEMAVDWNGLPEGTRKEDIWPLAPIDALTNDGLVYFKTQRGLLKSTDNGRNWYY